MINLLIDIPVYAPALEKLEKMHGVHIKLIEKPEEKSRLLPTELVRDCDILFCTFLPQNYDEMGNLKMVQIASAGYTQLIGMKLAERNIKACNALGVFDIPIAEWNIAMMINLKRNIRQLMDNQEHQVWDRAARFQKEIFNGVVGIWGYGGIGRETARLAKALGMKVRVLTRHGINKREDIYRLAGTGDPDGKLPDEVFLMKDQEKFLTGLDFLIMAIPLNKQTEGIVGERELKLLGKNAYLLNPARGPLVQEKALLDALKNGWIAGAAIDTHYHYPMPPEHPLWKFKNVIMTPHISGSSANPKFLERTWDIFVQNVMNFIADKPLINELKPEQLKGH
ncbi:MAG: D-2-hydroxyacid dehydrogenase [Chitinophagaceae bacterium]|nr:MAG: D-2-hydroxyacid dehydrogenase [Chitinophagaceae bacterium]